MATTLNKINAALVVGGHQERLFRGKGYFYFSDGNTPNWPATSVCVYRLNELTLEQWLEEHASLKAKSRG